MRTARIGPLFVGLVVTLAATGIGYGFWTASLSISDEITTGALGGGFTAGFTDDDAVVDDPALDSLDDAECDETSGCDPAAVGPDPKARHDRDIATCRVTIEAPEAALVEQSGAYPGYACTSWFTVTNTGSVPFRIVTATVGGVLLVPGSGSPFDLDGDGAPDVLVSIAGITEYCLQVDPGDQVVLEVGHEILPDVPQDAVLGHEIEIALRQWNETCEP